MAHYAVLIDYDYCTGCHTCEIACQQEHDYPVGTNGIVVKEYEYEAEGRVRIEYLPFFTQHCDLCKVRRARAEVPACVRHCQARCMEFGTTAELAAKLSDRPNVALFTHSPGRRSSDMPA
jgi:anaerobic dimethyl sulfoxide reductase subunit B (iron-sulfur subunit)